MSKIKLINVSKSFGEKKLFEIDNLEILEGQKIGIVGKNGTGKSTFLNIIANKIQPDTGKIETKGKISYINQLDNIEENRFSKISGGEKMLEIIKNKIKENPDILLADEPSTNLDIFNVQYLIKQLKEYKGILLIISHDRSVLDNICDYIIEIENGCIKKYKGNYTDYKMQKNMEKARKKFEYFQYIREKERLQKAIIGSKNNEKSIKKAPKRMGNSETRLHKREATEKREKLEQHSKALETRLKQLQEKEKPEKEYSIYFQIPENLKIRSKEIIKSDKFSLTIQGKQLLVDTKFYIPTNKKIAIIGKNGVGKTSFIKRIINKDEQININPQASIGYFSQKLDNLDENSNVLENVIKDSVQDERTVRNILASLYLKDDKVYSNVKDLSGGEKVKVALAKILVSNANLLILDEPTNFLDIESIEGLENLIKAYTGTVLVISHDKDFIDNVCDNIILIEDKNIKQYEGNYSQYLTLSQNRRNKKIISNDRILLEFKLTKLNSEIALVKDEKEKGQLENERKSIIEQLANIN